MRRLALLPLAALALLAAPGSAAADVIFDQADADELAATLAEAYETQDVCYGWSIDVDNEGVPTRSVGSNFGAGQSIQDSGSGCASSVEFQASITWTSESSESEDSASYQVLSQPSGPSTSDLDDLELISDDGLKGDNVDADVYKAVSALPLLAADAGLADPIEASPAPESDAGDAKATDSPGSDFWRESGMLVLWGSLLVVAGAVFAVYAVRSSRRPARRMASVGPPAEQIPEYVPQEWSGPADPENPDGDTAGTDSADEVDAETSAAPDSAAGEDSAVEPAAAEPTTELAGPSAEAAGEPAVEPVEQSTEDPAQDEDVKPVDEPVQKPATRSDPEPRPDE